METKRRILRNDTIRVIYVLATVSLLLIASLYRIYVLNNNQLNLQSAIVIHVLYLIPVIFWSIDSFIHIMQTSIRVFVMTEYVLVALWLIVRFVQAAFLQNDETFHRNLGYFIVVLGVLIPLMTLYSSICTGKNDEYKLPKAFRLFLLPAFVIIIMSVANDLTCFIFKVEEGPGGRTVLKPQIGLLVLLGWVFIMLLARSIILDSVAKKAGIRGLYRIMPFMVVAAMFMVNLYYAWHSFAEDTPEIFEYSVMLLLLELVLWQISAVTGIIPSNTNYAEAFQKSTLNMQITDIDGRIILKSDNATELSPEDIKDMMRGKHIEIGMGKELIARKRGQYHLIWENDSGPIVEAIKKLRETNAELRKENEVISAEIDAENDLNEVTESQRIYSLISAETRQSSEYLQSLVDIIGTEEHDSSIYRKIIFIGTYIKRRNNLKIISEQGDKIAFYDLRLTINDMARALKKAGISFRADIEGEPDDKCKYVFEVVDGIEKIVRENDFNVSSINILVTGNEGYRIDYEK